MVEGGGEGVNWHNFEEKFGTIPYNIVNVYTLSSEIIILEASFRKTLTHKDMFILEKSSNL